MRNAIMVEPKDIKKILAEKFGVSEDKVIKTQYSYTIIADESEDESNEDD